MHPTCWLQQVCWHGRGSDAGRRVLRSWLAALSGIVGRCLSSQAPRSARAVCRPPQARCQSTGIHCSHTTLRPWLSRPYAAGEVREDDATPGYFTGESANVGPLFGEDRWTAIRGTKCSQCGMQGCSGHCRRHREHREQEGPHPCPGLHPQSAAPLLSRCGWRSACGRRFGSLPPTAAPAES